MTQLERYTLYIDGVYFKSSQLLSIGDLCVENERNWKLLVATNTDQTVHKFDRTCFSQLPQSWEIICKWEWMSGRFYSEKSAFAFPGKMIVVLKPCSKSEVDVICLRKGKDICPSLWCKAMKFNIPDFTTSFQVSVADLGRVSTMIAVLPQATRFLHAACPILEEVKDYVVMTVDEHKGQRVHAFDLSFWQQTKPPADSLVGHVWKHPIFEHPTCLKPRDESFIFNRMFNAFWSEVHQSWLVVLMKSYRGIYHHIPRWDVHHGAVLLSHKHTQQTTNNQQSSEIPTEDCSVYGDSSNSPAAKALTIVREAVVRATKECQLSMVAQTHKSNNKRALSPTFKTKDALPNKKKVCTLQHANVDLEFMTPSLDSARRNANMDTLFYDKDGILLTCSEITKTCYIVTKNGSMLDLQNEQLGLFVSGVTQNGTEINRVGKAVDWHISPDDLHVVVKVQWLHPTNTNAKTNLSSFFGDKCSWLPLSSYKGPLMHLPNDVLYDCIPDYVGAYFQYATMLQNQQSTPGTLADYLELYHVQVKSIWRTCIGRYMWTNYLAKAMVFGREPNLSLASNAMSMNVQKWKLTKHKTSRPFFCTACNKRQVGKMSTIAFEKGQKIDVGSTCADRIEDFYKIGVFLRRFRSKPFDSAQRYTFLYDYQTMLNTRFSK